MTTTHHPVVTETHEVGAVFRLACARQQHPELAAAEAKARIVLAAAIIAMDTAGESGTALTEQLAVEQARYAYAIALADLLRGQKDSCIVDTTEQTAIKVSETGGATGLHAYTYRPTIPDIGGTRIMFGDNVEITPGEWRSGHDVTVWTPERTPDALRKLAADVLSAATWMEEQQ